MLKVVAFPSSDQTVIGPQPAVKIVRRSGQNPTCSTGGPWLSARVLFLCRGRAQKDTWPSYVLIPPATDVGANRPASTPASRSQGAPTDAWVPASHSWAVWSLLPVSSHRPSGLQASEPTSSAWNSVLPTGRPVGTSHNWTVPSRLAV